MTATSKIQDYTVIGSGRSAALASRHGSIDCRCWPRFDSPSLFGRLTGLEAGWIWSIAPAEPAETERTYIDATNVLPVRRAGRRPDLLERRPERSPGAICCRRRPVG
jgi:GH15 family glucan-1,4-alpha-glucosidase